MRRWCVRIEVPEQRPTGAIERTHFSWVSAGPAIKGPTAWLALLSRIPSVLFRGQWPRWRRTRTRSRELAFCPGRNSWHCQPSIHGRASPPLPSVMCPVTWSSNRASDMEALCPPARAYFWSTPRAQPFTAFATFSRSTGPSTKSVFLVWTNVKALCNTSVNFQTVLAVLHLHFRLFRRIPHLGHLPQVAGVSGHPGLRRDSGSSA